MGCWENTTYVKSSNPLWVLQALENLFRKEGMHRVAIPSQKERCEYEPMQYAPALENDVWGVAVFPGSESWTVIKTAPLELLSEQASDGKNMRLSDLCRELSTVGFQVHVYDGTSAILCEVEENGETHISGCGDFNSDDPETWQGHHLPEELFDARFQVLPYQEVIAQASLGDDYAFAISAEFGGKNAKLCDNSVSVELLITHAPSTIEGVITAFFEWSGPTRIKIPACTWEEWHIQGSK